MSNEDQNSFYNKLTIGNILYTSGVLAFGVLKAKELDVMKGKMEIVEKRINDIAIVLGKTQNGEIQKIEEMRKIRDEVNELKTDVEMKYEDTTQNFGKLVGKIYEGEDLDDLVEEFQVEKKKTKKKAKKVLSSSKKDNDKLSLLENDALEKSLE
jgi:hypothetical protein